MARSAVSLARLLPTPAAADAPLLRAFLTSNGEAAFEELVRRHGPMVLATCRRVLGNPHDAEDAFQATFLVLARKAGTIRGNLTGWLYGVAVRTARGVRVMRDRRRKRESLAANGRAAVAIPVNDDHDLAEVIDEELAKLPEHYREAIVVCELRGLSRKQAAAELGIAEGTLSSRLAVGKKKLAARLAARGLAAPAMLAPIFAPATLSAALVQSAAVLTRGAAGPVASAAAGAVVKGMLFEQLKSVALAGGVLLSMVCGGLAMTGVSGGSDAAAQAATDPAAKLVEQLGAPEFADREAAAKALREMGLKAEAALRTGLKSESREIRNRSAEVLNQIRETVRKAFLAGKAEPASSAWKRFKELVGNTESSRKLFVEMMADDRRADAVEKAEANPARAAEVYATEVVRVAETGLKSFEKFIGQPALIPEPGQSDPKAAESRKAVGLGDVVAVLFLGTHPLPDGAKDPSALWAFKASFADGAGGPLKEPFCKLVAAWIDQRRDPATIRDGLETALFAGVSEVLPTARRLVVDAKLPAPAKGWAVLAVGNYGTPTDLLLLAGLKDDTRAYREYTTIKKETYQVQVRDAAVAMSLLLRGQDFEEYGFEHTDWMVWWLPTNPAPLKAVHWFQSDKAREAAHKKAWEWLDKQPKPEPKKEDPKPDLAVLRLIEQLNAPEFADREAAAKALREKGLKAEAALRTGLKSESPEVRARAAKLLNEIRTDARKQLAKSFKPEEANVPDHPVWKRFQSLAGDTAASRALFAQMIQNKTWLARLDAAEVNPEKAPEIYREAIVEVGKHFRSNMAVWFDIPVWPCDRIDEVAYLLVLGSYPGTNVRLAPPELHEFNDGEGRIHFARGLGLGLQGKVLDIWTGKFQPDVVAAPEGTDRVFAKLLAAWLEQRDPTAVVVPPSLWLAAEHRAKEVLPFARRMATLDFVHKRLPNANLITAALAVIARCGTADDRPLFESYFTNDSVIARFEFEGPVPVGLKTSNTGTAQFRDVAMGLVLLLYGEDPAKHGFLMASGGRANSSIPVGLARFRADDFGFLEGDNKSRAAAHANVKAFLEKQPKPDPAAKSGEQLGAADWKKAKEAFAKDPKGFQHPVRTRLQEIVGDGDGTRELLADLLADERAFGAANEAIRNPKEADRLYREILGRLVQDLKKWHEANPKNNLQLPAPGRWQPNRSVYAAFLFLGTFPGTGAEPSAKMATLLQQPAEASAAWNVSIYGLYGDKNPAEAALRKLFVAWMGQRSNPDATSLGFSTLRLLDRPDAIELARTVAADRKKPSPDRAEALLYVGIFGKVDDVPLAMALLDDRTEFKKVHVQREVQVRDIATAVALRLHGQDPVDHGFFQGRGNDSLMRFQFLGFPDEASRTRVLKPAREWLEKKEQERMGKGLPELSNLVSQLGSADFAEREAAQGALRKLGYKAEGVIRAGLKSENPEVVKRCNDLLDALRNDLLGGKESPVWLKMKNVVGDDAEGWKFYLRTIGTRWRAEMLLNAVNDPKVAAASYETECREIRAVVHRAGLSGIAPPPKQPGEPEREVTRDDLAALLVLGLLPREGQKEVPQESSAVISHLLHTALDVEPKGPFRKLFVAWIEPRKEMWQAGVNFALTEEIPGMANVASKLLTEAKSKPQAFDQPANALRLLGLHGTKDDIPLVMKFADDKTVCGRMEFSKIPGGTSGPWRPAIKDSDVTVQVGDVALFTALQLHKQNPAQFGFLNTIIQDGGPPPKANWLVELGFCREEDRAEAHKKAKEWLKKQ